MRYFKINIKLSIKKIVLNSVKRNKEDYIIFAIKHRLLILLYISNILI